MSHDVIMPQMGESIAEGTVTQWLKKVGDRVARDEPLFEISTDKVDAEIPSPVEGVLLEIKVQPGQTVPVNTVVAVVGDAGGASAGNGNGRMATARAGGAEGGSPAAMETRDLLPERKARPAPVPLEKAAADTTAKTVAQPGPLSVEDEGGPPEPATKRPSPPPTAAPSAAPARLAAAAQPPSAAERRHTKSSPVVRKIAAEHGVDLARLSGTGIGGRVTKDDILSYLEQGEEAPLAAAGASLPQTASGTGAELRGPIPDAYRPRVHPGDRIEDMSTMRTKIAEHMLVSRRVSAHTHTVWDVDATRIVQLRAKHKDVWRERHGVSLTYTAFLMKAAVDALKAFPVVNASIDGNRVIYHQSINLGLAVALDWGLIVPVVQGAGELNLLGLQRRANDLAERARTKRLKPDEVQNGTFTITNPGVYGSLFGLPIINQPQVAIMGVGAIEKRPVVIDDMLAVRSRLYMSLSFDHRIVDGAVADQFMARVKKNVEEFDEAEM